MISASGRRVFVYIGYIDDSGSTGGNLDDAQAPFQVIGGPLIEDSAYVSIEVTLARVISGLIPEENYESFEFHAADLYYGKPPFDALGIEKCRGLIEQALTWTANLQFPIVYGAVDKAKLNSQITRTADPVDISFQLYLDGLWKWFDGRFFKEPDHPTGLLICDETPNRKHRATIEKAFRRNRSKPRGRGSGGLAMYLFDDIYFGSSANSIGIQLADICVYFIARHLAGKIESEAFYSLIKDQIVCSEVYPNDASFLNDLERIILGQQSKETRK